MNIQNIARISTKSVKNSKNPFSLNKISETELE
jgi:hypothetical protein